MSETPVRLLGKRVKATESIICPDIGTELNPVQNLHMKTPIIHYQDDIAIKDISADNLTKFKVKTDGVMEVAGGIHLHSGNDVEASGSKRFSVALDPPAEDDFVIRDEVNGVDRMKIDGTTGIITFDPPLPAGIPQTGYRYVWNTQGITQYNRSGSNYGLEGKFYDPGTGQLRYDNIFLGSPIGSYAWNPKIAPTGSIPSNQTLFNNSPIPGFIAPGFVCFNTTGKTPVKVNIKGKFFPDIATLADGALVNGTPMYPHPYQANFYTANFKFRVGWVRRYYDPSAPPPGLIIEEICANDYTIPIMGNSPHDFLDFSADFSFEMERNDPGTGINQEYMPYFNHNGYNNVGGVSSNIRWRSVEVTIDTLADI